MRKAISLVLTVGMCAILGSSSVQAAAPSIYVDWDPRIPGHVENPDGLFYGYCLVDPDGGTPMDLIVRVIGPDGLYYEQNFPGEVEYELFWQVPAGAQDGIYTYEVEYRSAEGDVELVNGRFIVAGFLTGLCAVKFIDTNGNGIFDDGEEPGEGWEICANGPMDLGCQNSDQDGLACWFGISPGVYEVCETLMDGWENTTGGVCQDLDAPEGEIAKILIGNWIPPVPVENKTWGEIKNLYR
jgi:hypothetical protein